MNNAELKEFLVSRVRNAVVTDGPQYVTAQIPAENWLEAAHELKQNASTAFDYLFCLSGVDMPDHLMVVYHLESTTHRHAMVVKVKTNDRIQAHVPSVAGIWPTANFHEREAFDLLGIKFTGHPDLRRFFMDDDQGHPLRKDYKDENRIVER